MIDDLSFETIRTWDGSKHRAFEELAFQLREPAPPGSTEVKTGDPDAGVEWYVTFESGDQWGWQAKYIFETDTLLSAMRTSVKAVAAKRPQLTRLTFCIPIDLPEDIRPGTARKSARRKFEDAARAWKRDIPGAADIEFAVETQGVLLERLARSDNRGKQWFWWHREVFSPAWCRSRLDETLQAVGPRYTPAVHVDIPIACVLQGLANSPDFRSRYRRYRGDVVRAAHELVRRERVPDELAQAYDAMLEAVSSWVRIASAPDYRPHELAPYKGLLAATGECLDRAYVVEDAARERLYAARADKSWSAADDDAAKQRRSELDAVSSVVHHTQRYASSLARYRSFLESTAMLASHKRCLFMTGSAGQGKTHLLCDAANKVISEGAPALVLLGERFGGRGDPWGQVAAQLGLGQLGGEVLIGAMEAAAEAANGRFVFLIDAVNESEDAALWRAELRMMSAQLSRTGWVGFGVSCRSSYVDVVVPPDGLGDVFTTADHPGFANRETEALSKFFEHFKLEQPRVPLLVPEFSNPLFLKLYCEGLAALGMTSPPTGHQHPTAVFERFVHSRAKRVNQELDLDPADRILEGAVQSLADAIATAGGDYLPYETAKALTDAFAPMHTRWPQTLFGLMLSEGVLRRDRVYLGEDEGPVEAVGFAYQRFSDHLVVGALLDQHLPRGEDPARALAEGTPFGALVREAHQGILEALSVQLPERTGTELLDAIGPSEAEMPGSWRRERWFRAFLDSIVVRDRRAVTERTRELLNEGQAEHRLFSDVLEVLLAVAPDPDHPLNAEVLHRALASWPLPDRDALWTHEMYRAWRQDGQLERLIRWASAAPYPTYEGDVLELAAIPLVWTLTSPNRFARDFVTKALVQLLYTRLEVLTRLIDRFQSVDDPYVLERLAVISHGAVLRGGARDQRGALGLAGRLRDVVLEGNEATPQMLTRDAVRGLIEWCVRQQLMPPAALDAARPPYGARLPKVPRSRKWLEETYDRFAYDDARPGYGRLFGSVFEDDFAIYVIGSKLSHFTGYRLGETVPEPGGEPEPEIRVRRREHERFARSLAPDQVAAYAALDGESSPPDSIESFFRSLSPEQLSLLQESYSVRRRRHRRDPKLDYSMDRAKRWIFERCLELGWTPERFGEFDKYLDRRGRDNHKAERFGKKYQWIALRELFARVADNYHWREGSWAAPAGRYEGPWQVYARDIDPTLRPALPSREEDDFAEPIETFSVDGPDAWWVPAGPRYRAREVTPANWVFTQNDLPQMPGLLKHLDADGTQWVLLRAYLTWKEEVPEDEDAFGKSRRELWTHLYPWLVRRGEERRLEAFLRRRTLMNRWMPEGSDFTVGPYLGELPWAEPCQEYPPRWGRDRFSEQLPVDVLPFANSYTWEGRGLDCSLEESVQAFVPVQEVFEAGRLAWDGEDRSWACDGALVVQSREARAPFLSHSGLLVEERWLARVLDEMECSLVVGLLGEKRFLGGREDMAVRQPWLEINGRTSFDGSKWRHSRLQVEEQSPA
jgi:hypothetical protein